MLRNFEIIFICALCLTVVCDKDSDEAVEVATEIKVSNLRSNKYTDIKRIRSTTTTSTPVPKAGSDVDDDDDSDEDEPRIISNGRGGYNHFLEEEDENSEPVREAKPKSEQRYIEIRRPGAVLRTKTKTTTTEHPPPKPVIIEEEEDDDDDDSKRPDGCNQCRYYCKQCRGAEEVTSGGVWGCCNHNCCGGRCSCMKVKRP